MRELEDSTWCDVVLVDGEAPTVTYRTAMTVYEESLIRGRFVGRGWNGSGFVPFYDGRIDPASHPAPQAFWIELDGQLLASDWEWAGFEKKAGPSGGMEAAVTLKHAVRPVTLKVVTKLDGTPVLARWVEITNTGAAPAALSTCAPWSGVLQVVNRWRSHLGDSGLPLYSVGYFDNTRWGNEGDFQWHDLPAAGYQIAGRYRRESHRHPWFVLRNNATGEHFIGQLAWSGGYVFEFDLAADTSEPAARLFFRAGPDAPAPQRVIAPGETIRCPEVHVGMVFGDLDTAIQAMHEHLRRSVFMPQPRGRGGWVESAIGPEIEITADDVIQAIDMAADVGAEVFFIDASWYAPPQGKWWTTVGDWNVDRKRFPGGLKPFRDRTHAKGMLWGLWMDAERIGEESQTAKEHPDWIVRGYDGQELNGMLDLTNPEAAQWMEAQIVRVIEENELDFFRLDYNTSGVGRTRHGDFVECHFWRYYEAQYAIYERLRARFPDVIFENCAGGGGRTDIGMVRRFSHTWVTDWQIAPRSFTITNGMTMALPPEYVDRLLGGQTGYVAADFDFQSRLLLFVRPTIGFPRPPNMEWNPHLLERMKHFVGLYKEFIRPFMSAGRIYHHTPSVPAPDPQGWGVLELVSADRQKAICGIFRLGASRESEYVLRLRGLDVSRRYRVTFDNDGRTCDLPGVDLMKHGLTIRLEGALTSELLVLEAI
ncbi:MAG: alpha-galactosidase [Verrucomicrobia bacterium]|nr:alpha-galactosidase [Verrucomicrobiota bacterium]